MINQNTIESKRFPGYYHIPGFSKYVINKNGNIINIVTGNNIHFSIINNYYSCPLWGDDNKKHFVKKGRLLCIVFKPIEDYEYLVIDHINCNKLDDRLENLEWVTPKENSRRAGIHGLMGKHVAVQVRDWLTKEITVYQSMREAARSCGLSIHEIKYRLNCNDGRVFPEKKQYKRVSDLIDFQEKEDIDIEIARYGKCKRVLLRSLLHENVMEYDKMEDMAKHLNMPLSTISTYMAKSETKQPVIPGLYQIKMKNDPRDWIDYDDYWLELQKVTGYPIVQIINEQTGEFQIFQNQLECAKVMNVRPSTLNNRLKNIGSNKVFPDGYRYGYYPFD